MIYVCMPYYNEEMMARIWVNNSNEDICLNFLEADYTFKYKYKGYIFPEDIKLQPNVKYLQMDGRKEFVPNNKFGKIRLILNRFAKDSYNRGMCSPAWYNDAKQRNGVANSIKPKDDDYVILCDIDEVLDMRFLDDIIHAVNKHGIVTCKLRHTLFYFNLFVEGWGGSADYSYRMFIMTGNYFNNMNISSDELRKRGEQGQILNEIYCVDDFCGFHHSWLGDAKAAMDKMGAYAHSAEEHLGSSEDYIAECIANGKAFFEGIKLVAYPEVALLPEVEKMRIEVPELFWRGQC